MRSATTLNPIHWLKGTDFQKENSASDVSSYLFTGGVEILSNRISIESGARIAITSSEAVTAAMVCDILLGFKSIEKEPIQFVVGEKIVSHPEYFKNYAAILGHSPLMYGETVQDAILYRTSNVKKAELYYFIERLYGKTLKAKTNPQNPILDPNNKILPLQILTEKEHVEIAEINAMLAKLPLVVFDLTSNFMNKALEQGYKPSRELIESGKTILVIMNSAENISDYIKNKLGFDLTGTIEVTA